MNRPLSDPTPINLVAPSPFEACPQCGSATRMTLLPDWQARVDRGVAIPIVGCGNPWHYGGMPPFMLEQLRQQGLLEGDDLAEAWDGPDGILTDRVIGDLLLTRHGVVAGRDGDRIYLRKADKDLAATKGGPWHRRTVELLSLLSDATKVQREPCNHSGIGRPGCVTCDPRLRETLGIGDKASR